MKYEEIKAAITATPGIQMFAETSPRNNLSKDFRGSIVQEITLAVVATEPTLLKSDLNPLLRSLQEKLPDAKREPFQKSLVDMTFGWIKVHQPVGKVTTRFLYQISDGVDGPQIVPPTFDSTAECSEEITLSRSVTIRLYPCREVALHVQNITDGTFANHLTMRKDELSNIAKIPFAWD